jgi:peroxiredoxin
MTISFESQESPVHPLAPVFALKDVNDRTISLADYTGKVIILTFWKPSCLLCERESSNLTALLGKYGNQGMVAIGISMDSLPVQKSSKISYPFVRGNKQTLDQYGSPIAPTTFVIGRDRRIYSKHSEYVPSAVLEAEITQLLVMTEAAELASFKPSAKAEKIDLPNENELNTQIPGIDITVLSPSQIKMLEDVLDGKPCPCGCGNTMLSCRRRHGECQTSRAAAQQEWRKLLNQSK